MVKAKKLKIGDLVSIKGKSGVFVVIKAENVRDEDRMRGDFYYVDQFEVIRFNGAGVKTVVANPKIGSYYFTEGSMHGRGTGISMEDIQIKGVAKVRTVSSAKFC